MKNFLKQTGIIMVGFTGVILGVTMVRTILGGGGRRYHHQENNENIQNNNKNKEPFDNLKNRKIFD